LHLGRSVKPGLVGDKRLGREALLFELFPHELRGRPLRRAAVAQGDQNLALVVDRSPKPELSTADPDSHLVEVPVRRWSMTSAAKLLGERRTELQPTVS
jgi:hypothetical protein